MRYQINVRIQYNSAFETSLLWIPLDPSPFEAPAIQLSRHGSPQAQWACHGPHGGHGTGGSPYWDRPTDLVIIYGYPAFILAIYLLSNRSWPDLLSLNIHLYTAFFLLYIKVYAQELPTGKGSADDPAAVSLSINWPSAIMKLVQQNWESYQR